MKNATMHKYKWKGAHHIIVCSALEFLAECSFNSLLCRTREQTTVSLLMIQPNAIVKYGFVEVILNLLKNLSAHFDIHAH